MAFFLLSKQTNNGPRPWSNPGPAQVHIHHRLVVVLSCSVPSIPLNSTTPNTPHAPPDPSKGFRTPSRSKLPPCPPRRPKGGDKSALRKPVFTKVDQLRPGTNGHTLTVKVVSANPVPERARPGPPPSHPPARHASPIALHGVMGTLSFMIYLTMYVTCPGLTMNSLSFYAVDLLKPDATVILRNAKIDMFKGSMRLAVDKWGRMEATESASFTVKEDNNLSLVEYELVNVAE
ncbi:hypothetical protein C2845_PM07G40400 [Panicum miliaceum]|uniref:Single-stranded DNA binding protein Ssb-like OB fold domain-containing protein n=1 Tax=Panicum miliaceum TaxID=4540 RepID=A0A3L6SQB6_PANMI|nr:hypothetical protein C2845_PM07G40400 [Panicum miliaceum]